MQKYGAVFWLNNLSLLKTYLCTATGLEMSLGYIHTGSYLFVGDDSNTNL